ncbi:transcription-repair coupling factor [Clostridium sp. MSJ-4]|uniref:Transcription-repair-coupling factor n=1 Tax=Clostridium simiarum TaxID=2841506 RepID=A0ABS6F3B8_9CLOT|nr:transcription-repair coupling factor [Clostridium simiarum]MBU5592103.1 transcription-repair coupling factor [Clostridium simiarum]
MRFKGLLEPLKQSKEFASIKENIKENRYPISIYGISESAKSYIIDAIYEEEERPFFIISHSDLEAKNLYEDLSLYIPEIYYFPTKEVVFYNVDAISGDLRWERLKVIKEMIRPGKKVIVTSVEAFSPCYTPIDLYKKYNLKYNVGDVINIEDLTEKLIQCGYERMDLVDGKGQFSVRGGILDIYPPISSSPYRIELFGDEVDSIRTFNVESQRSIQKVKEVEIFPAKEMILSTESIQRGYGLIKKDLDSFVDSRNSKKNKDMVQKINKVVNANLESLKESWNFETIDSYLPYFFENPSNFFDYIDDGIIILDDVQRSMGKLESIYYEFEENYKAFLERGDILPRQGELLVLKESIVENLTERALITLESIAKTNKYIQPRAIYGFSEITLTNYGGQLDFLIEDIKDKKSKGYKTIILSGTRPRGERLVDTLRDKGIESVYKDIVSEIQYGEVVVTFGNQLKGFEYPELKICVISDRGVFGESKRKTKKRVSSKKGVAKIKSFAELKPGDYVVHVNHGIGVYKGIKQLELEGHKRDYLDISYDKGDKLYVPVEQLDMVQKYIGSEGKSPKVNKLGGSEWAKAKSKVKKSINEIAEDLVKLYATRSTLKGYKYSLDTVWQKQFEEEFPYDETPDQITSLEEIKGDMESDKPMDRLLCGDVGYGKTEVAMRAAFKAVMDGKQVAFLVPTTILAEQHYKNMLKRFSDFPIKIDMLSRFRSAAQQKVTLKAVKEGNVDVLIGTHRLISKDVNFKDLGLLIVDEEQRFGVTHKEKIKNLKKNIDVLTLSATPIPRTLHMSLTGVRDISVIETPPEERYPIQTYVVEYNDQLIRDAILRELNRKGQIYFVYNRVEDIKNMAGYLQNLVPEVRIGIAHGQMTERELEKVMLGFISGEIDMIVCTTIIETGMDIQNVNTMIVYDADRMGLSQLYQLRGRVGRTNRIAYSYFTYKKDKILTEVAEKRLKALKEFTELGSGFKIAMRDLEIRGAGNMMGSAQHGHMAAVGYDLYCRMLEDTIKLIKGDIEKEPVETTIDLNIDAYIPNQYIEDEVQKIEIYKKIASIENQEDMYDIMDELEDRFSDISQPVNNLINISYIRSLGKILNIEEIKEKEEEVIFQFDSKNSLDETIIKGLMDKYSKKVIFKFGEKPAFGYRIAMVKKEEILDEFKSLLEYMVTLRNK